MKKSKIIIPALAIIAFSTAASIAGSVAWFTASRQATISAGTYAVVKTSADLQCHVASGVGTTATDDNNKVITVNGVLSDGSFSHKEDASHNYNVYTPNASGKAIAKETALSDADFEDEMERGTAKVSGVDKTIYTAVTWEMSFTVSFGGVEGDIALYLDTNAAKSYFSVGTAAAVTGKGFRMAFVPHDIPSGSSAKATVFADLQEKGKCSYISGMSAAEFASPTTYDEDDYDLIDINYAATLPTTGTSADDYTDRPDFLGKFGFSAGAQATLSYTVVCWFEGTDENIVNQNDPSKYQSVQAQLAFEAVDMVIETPAP